MTSLHTKVCTSRVGASCMVCLWLINVNYIFAVLACISQFSSQRVLFSVCAMECCGKGQYKIVSPAPTSTTCPNIKKTQCFVIVGQNANVHDHGFHLQRTAWQNVR